MTIEELQALRARTGCGLQDCKRALYDANGDVVLAEGLLRYNGAAIHIKPRPGQTEAEAYTEWVWRRAREWARDHANTESGTASRKTEDTALRTDPQPPE